MDLRAHGPCVAECALEPQASRRVSELRLAVLDQQLLQSDQLQPRSGHRPELHAKPDHREPDSSELASYVDTAPGIAARAPTTIACERSTRPETRATRTSPSPRSRWRRRSRPCRNRRSFRSRKVRSSSTSRRRRSVCWQNNARRSRRIHRVEYDILRSVNQGASASLPRCLPRPLHRHFTNGPTPT